jgi:hypothetical protein
MAGSPAPLAPLSPEERDIVTRVVDAAPPISAGTAAEIKALLAPSDPFVDRFRSILRGVA